MSDIEIETLASGMTHAVMVGAADYIRAKSMTPTDSQLDALVLRMRQVTKQRLDMVFACGRIALNSCGRSVAAALTELELRDIGRECAIEILG